MDLIDGELRIDENIDDKHFIHGKCRPNHHLVAFAAKKDLQDEEPFNSGGLQSCGLVHEIQWSLDLSSSTARKLINQSHLVFTSVQQQKLHSKENVLSNNVLLKFSRNYRSILRSCMVDFKSQHQPNGDPYVQHELQSKEEIYGMMELIWSLCEILFIENLTDGAAIVQLMEWCKWHFPVATELVAECTRLGDDVSPADHPHYWNSIFALLLQGRVSEAQEMLKLHLEFQATSYSPFTSMDELLRKMPVFVPQQGQSASEFEMKWRYWQDECQKRLRDGDFDSTPNLRVICQMLAGEEEVFHQMRDLCGSWYHMLISYLFYSNPTISSYDVHYHSTSCVNVMGGATELTPLDNILLAVFKYDVAEVIRDCCKNLSNWWLPVHLADMLSHSRLFPPKSTENESDLRESLVVKYAGELASQPHLWTVVADYFAHCGPKSRHYLALFVHRIPVESEKKAAKVMRLCDRYQLMDEAQSICRQMSMRALQHKRLGTALTWSIKANDPSFAMHVANLMLHEYATTGTFSNIDVIDYLGPSVLMSERLTFLGKYRDFQKLYADGKFREAGFLLLNLLVSKTAPKQFWPSLLMDCLPLLERESPVYGIEETSSLLMCLDALEQTTNETGGGGDAGGIPRKSDGDRNADQLKLSHLRLALVDNLARAYIAVQ